MTGKLAVALPLVSGSDDASSVAEMMNRYAASAVIVSDGGNYRVHSIEQVRAVGQDSGRGAVRTASDGAKIGMLSTRRAAELGLNLSDLDAAWVAKAFESLDQPAVITGIAHASNGVRFATTIVNPATEGGTHSFLFLGDTFKCPVDGEVFSKPGKCSVHPGETLIRVKS